MLKYVNRIHGERALSLSHTHTRPLCEIGREAVVFDSICGKNGCGYYDKFKFWLLLSAALTSFARNVKLFPQNLKLQAHLWVGKTVMGGEATHGRSIHRLHQSKIGRNARHCAHIEIEHEVERLPWNQFTILSTDETKKNTSNSVQRVQSHIMYCRKKRYEITRSAQCLFFFACTLYLCIQCVWDCLPSRLMCSEHCKCSSTIYTRQEERTSDTS